MISILVRVLLVSIVIFIIVGIIFSLFSNLPYIPGDFFYEKRNFTFHFPVLTCALTSLIVAIILWFTKKV